MPDDGANLVDVRPPSRLALRRPVGPAAVGVEHQLAPLRGEWDELADRTGAAPFLRPGWIEAWMRAWGAEPLALTLRRDGRLAGLLPLNPSAGALSSPTNWQTPLFGMLAEDGDAATELANALLAETRRRADLWFLDPAVPGHAETAGAARQAGYGVIARTIAQSPYLSVEGSFDEYMASLNRKFRKDIGRRWRRLEEQGDVRVEYEDDIERLDSLLTQGFRLEGSGWKAEAGTAIASEPRRERFYREVARWAAERGWLKLAFLYLDDRPLAFDYCIEQGGVAYIVKGGFDVEARSLGPGVLLTHHEIERAFELGFSSYELLGQSDDYKLSWTQTTRERTRIQLFPPTPVGMAEYAAWRYGRPLVQRARAAISDRRSSRSP